jgi:thiol-disulfide isomerase/thioredoxin
LCDVEGPAMNAMLRNGRRLLAIAALGLAGGAASEVPSAGEVLDAAFSQAQTEHKNVLVHFGASWCTWCRHLDAMLQGPEVGDLFQDSYVISHLTIMESDDAKALENPGALELAEAAVGKVDGVPFFMIFDAGGERLATSLALPNGGNIGHPVTAEEIEAFVGLLEKTAPNMTAADRDRISGYLSRKTY